MQAIDVTYLAFFDELEKIAEAQKTIPVIRSLPQNDEKALSVISKRVDSSDVKVLGHKNVAVPVEVLGPLEDYGFKKTRLAVPLPSEWPGTSTWRKGQLHAHKIRDYYLFHKDKTAPRGVVHGLKHWFTEGMPASIKRLHESADAVGQLR
jgi:hypothetical protein